jgi:hypothetical protein
MQSTLTARDADPHDTFVIEPDVVLAARADAPGPPRREPNLRALVSEISAGVAEQATAPKVDTSFRSVAVEKRRGRWVSSFVVAFLFALVSALGAAAWQRYGDRAQADVANAASLLGLSTLQATSAPSAPAAADATPEQTAAPAETASTSPADAAAATTPAAPDQTQLVQSLTRDVAAMGQQIEQLKATIAELKAGQEQVAHDAKAADAKASEAKASEQSMRAKFSALPQRPSPAVRKPKPYMPAQASAAPPPPGASGYVPPLPPPGAPGSAPVQIAPAPPPPVAAATQDDVPRPPMPVR